MRPPWIFFTEVNGIANERVAAWENGQRPKYNASRRACPDLSIYDSDSTLYRTAVTSFIGGTSAAFTLKRHDIVHQRAPTGRRKPTLGFLNYFLYQHEVHFRYCAWRKQRI